MCSLGFLMESKWNFADYWGLKHVLANVFETFCGHSRKQMHQFVSSTAPQTNQTKD